MRASFGGLQRRWKRCHQQVHASGKALRALVQFLVGAQQCVAPLAESGRAIRQALQGAVFGQTRNNGVQVVANRLNSRREARYTAIQRFRAFGQLRVRGLCRIQALVQLRSAIQHLSQTLGYARGNQPVVIGLVAKCAHPLHQAL